VKKLISILLVLVMLTATAGCSKTPTTNEPDSDAGKTALTFSYTAASASAVGTPGYNGEENFIKFVGELSAGLITVNQLAAGSVVSTEREATEAIQLGSIDMSAISDMGIDSVVQGLGWAWLPYMINTYEQADEFYLNGWMNTEIARIMLEGGVVKVANRENDFRILGIGKRSNRELVSVGDFKGLKVRVPEIKELLRFYQLAGGLSVAIAASETLTALSQGTIDAVDNSMLNLQLLGLLPEMSYLIPLNHMYSAGSFVANPDFWNGLTDWQREIITEAATKAGNIHIEESRAFSKGLMGAEGEAKYGYKVVPVSAELNAALKKVAVQVWEEFSSKYDPAMMKKVMDTFGNQ
jgi:TRAP-type C4-dicarboxylate transport system substrate-binding protein